LTRAEVSRQVDQFLVDNGALVRVNDAGRTHGVIVAQQNGTYDWTRAVPTLVMRNEDYGRISRIMDDGTPVTLRINIQNQEYPEGTKVYNAIGEIPGSDKADEVVMLGGHYDSWHDATGATDNGIGASMMLEAMRILATLHVKPRRTIRVALWGGEEQGMLGSKAWVEQHLQGDSNTLARAKFDVYFNIDNGTGPIYGWYLQNSKETQPLFDAWMEPLKTFGGKKNTIEPIGSTDHLSFTDIGLAGFNPIQDYSNYDIRTHHTNMDTAERLQMSDIRQAAAAMAWFAYCSAMNDQKIARPAARN
jgi:Zn-dependent M28 family amino/carboxypeptidase